MNPQTAYLIGLVLSILVAVTAKPVSKWIAPSEESVSAIPRTLLSVLWFVFVPFAAWIVAAVFLVLLAVVR